MTHKQNIIMKHLELLEKVYNINLQICKDSLKELVNPEEIDYKVYKSGIKSIIIEFADTSFKGTDLKHFPYIFGSRFMVDLIKLDSYLYNELIAKVKNLHSLSGLEKLKLYIDNNVEYKRVKRLI